MHLSINPFKPLISRLTMKKKFPEPMGENVLTKKQFYCYVDKYGQHWFSYSLFSRRDYIPKVFQELFAEDRQGESHKVEK